MGGKTPQYSKKGVSETKVGDNDRFSKSAWIPFISHHFIDLLKMEMSSIFGKKHYFDMTGPSFKVFLPGAAETVDGLKWKQRTNFFCKWYILLLIRNIPVSIHTFKNDSVVKENRTLHVFYIPSSYNTVINMQRLTYKSYAQVKPKKSFKICFHRAVRR